MGGLPDAPASSAFEEPARPLPSEHWPEPSEPTPDSPPHDDDADLATRLEDTPLDDALRERVDDYLRNGGDEPLEAALRQLGDPPMRVAFELLMG